MATISGTFTAPGVSASVAATKGVTFTLAGQVNACAVIFEQSTDAGATWQPFIALDQVLSASRRGPEAYTWLVSSGRYRINCTSFDSGFFSYTVLGW